MPEGRLIDQSELGGGGNSSGGTVGGMLNQTFATGGTRVLIDSLSPESAEEREKQRQAIMQQCAASGGYFAAGVCHTGQAAVDVATRQAESETASSAITDKANNWLGEHADEIDENGKFVGEVTEEQEAAAGEVTNTAEEQNVDTDTKDSEGAEEQDTETETSIGSFFKDTDVSVSGESSLFFNKDILGSIILSGGGDDPTPTNPEPEQKDKETAESEQKDKDTTEPEEKEKDTQGDTAEQLEKDAQVAEEETKDKDTTAEQAEKEATETEQKDKNISEVKENPEETEEKDKDAEQVAKDAAEQALKDTTPDDTSEAEQKDKDLSESINESVGNKDITEDAFGDTTQNKDTEDEIVEIRNKDTEQVTDLVSNKDTTEDSAADTQNKDTTEDANADTQNKDTTEDASANTQNKDTTEDSTADTQNKDTTEDASANTQNKDGGGSPEEQSADTQNKDGGPGGEEQNTSVENKDTTETSDLNTKDGEEQNEDQIFNKDGEMAQEIVGSKDSGGSEGDKDGENSLFELFKDFGGGVGIAAAAPKATDFMYRLSFDTPALTNVFIGQADYVQQLERSIENSPSNALNGIIQRNRGMFT